MQEILNEILPLHYSGLCGYCDNKFLFPFRWEFLCSVNKVNRGDKLKAQINDNISLECTVSS